VSFSILNDSTCINSNNIQLNGSPQGGLYSGAGIQGGLFYPNLAGVGSQIINYTYTDSLGCSKTIADSIYVNGCVGIESII